MYQESWGPSAFAGYLIKARLDQALCLPRFVKHFLNSSCYWSWISASLIQATIQNVSAEKYANLWIPLPSIEEQELIADFLDHKTRQLDTLIAKKQQLIDKLNEKRIALITQAVTKGLDASVPMKDSGVEWLGEVPTHWEVMHLSHAVRMKSGENITSVQINPAGTYPVYGGNGIRGYSEDFTHTGKFVLIGRQGALCGNINYASGDFWASEHAIVVTPDRTLDLVWLGELLRAMNLNQYSVAAAQPGLSVEYLGRLKIPFPPHEEQAEIAQLIKKQSDFIAKQIGVTESAISKLQEYRTALITATVTGKSTFETSILKALKALPDNNTQGIFIT